MKGEKQNMNKFITKLAKLFLGISMAAGVGVAIIHCEKLSEPTFAAENETHEFSQSLSQLLNNSATVADVTVAAQNYTVKTVAVTYSWNNASSYSGQVSIEVLLGNTSLGSQVTTTKDVTLTYNASTPAKAAVTVKTTNNTGSGSGHGTFKITKITLTEGPGDSGSGTNPSNDGTKAGNVSITLGSATGQWNARTSSTMEDADANGQTWTASYTTSPTNNSGTNQNGYIQFGSSNNPLSALSFVSSAFTKAMSLTAFSISYSQSGSGAKSKASLKIGSTNLKTSTNGVSDSNTSETLSWTGNETVEKDGTLNIVFGSFAKGTKVSTIAYTLAEISSDVTQTITGDTSGTVGTGVLLTTNATTTNWTITGTNTANATLTSASGKTTTVNATQAGSVTIQAAYTGYTTVTHTITFTMPTHSLTYAVGAHGSYDGSTIKSFSVTQGSNHTVLAPSVVGISAVNGYIFNGWNDGTNDYEVGASCTMGTSNVILTAQWVVDQNSYVTYTPSSRNAISTTGTAPSGSSATYYNTYSNANQMTGGNSVTLTLSGFDGCTITSLKLSMRSNSGGGKASLTFETDSSTISSISDSAFNSASWNGDWSTSYVNINVAVTSTKIAANKTAVLTISTSANSIYFGSATIGYLPNTDPTVTISTPSTDFVYDGSNSQNVAFTATPENFQGTVTYVWASSNASVISVTNAGTAANANLKIVGSGQANITATGTGSNGSATSAAVTLTVTNETYSGTLTITSASTANINDGGTITYSLTGNTHPMNVASFTSSNPSVINFANSSNPAFTTGSTKGASATVTVSLSSSVYSLETYQKSITITLTDPNSVTGVHFSGNITNKTVNFGGNYNLTAVLESESGNPTDTLVSWASANTSIVTVPNNHTDLTCPLTPVSPGETTVTVTTHDGGFQKVCTVTVNSSSTRVLDNISIICGEDAKTDYYDDDEEVVLDDITLSAHYIDPNYIQYDETVSVEVDGEGVEWTLDLTNTMVKVAYTVNQVTVYDEFAITVSERPKSETFLATEHTDFADGKVYILGPFTISVTNYVQTPSDSAPTYNSSNKDVRLYNKDYMTITCSDAVESIDSIVYEYTTKDSGKGDDYSLTLNTGGSYSKDGTTLTFENTKEIKFTAGSNQIRFKQFTINYTKVEAQDLDVESVELSESSINLESGYSQQLYVTVLPVDARDLSVTWTSDDEDVARVDENGLVTAVAAGSCSITATSNDQSSISDSCDVTVTSGPIFHFVAESSITNSQTKLGDVDFTISNPSGVTGYETARGAQFGSSNSNAGTVTFMTTDMSFAKKNLRVIVNAAHSGDGTSPSVSVSLGSASVGETQTITKTATDYEFELGSSGSSSVILTDLLTVTLHNGKGGVYLKSIKVYAEGTGSVIGDFCNNQLRMSSYDEGGTEGSTKGDGSCKTWWNDVNSAYNGLSGGQKTVFSTDDKYSAARARLSEWARINGAIYNAENGALTQNTYISPLAIIGENTNTIAIIVIISMVSVTAIGGYFFLRKRKENN